MTYKVTIRFSSGKRWSKGGLSQQEAVDLKDHFLSHVPAAESGWSAPEKKS